MNREHRTLNLIWWGLRFMCPAECDQRKFFLQDRPQDLTFGILPPANLDELLDV